MIRLTQIIFATVFLICLGLGGCKSQAQDLPFFVLTSGASCDFAYDDFESDTLNGSVAGLTGTTACWVSVYTVHLGTLPSLWAYDTMETYTNGAYLNVSIGGSNLLGGVDWTTAYVSHGGFLGIYAYDSMEHGSYTNTANLSGLNDSDLIDQGTTFNGAYDSH